MQAPPATPQVNSDQEGRSAPTRRGFLQLAGGSTVLLATLPAFAAETDAIKTYALELDKLPALRKLWGAARLTVESHEVIFVRDTPTTVRALDPTCTHKRCKVEFTAGDKRFHCDCHKSSYDLDGKVLGGPAPRPLTVYAAKLTDSQVLVQLPSKVTP